MPQFVVTPVMPCSKVKIWDDVKQLNIRKFVPTLLEKPASMAGKQL